MPVPGKTLAIDRVRLFTDACCWPVAAGLHLACRWPARPGKLLDLTRASDEPGSHDAWMFLSDHGQEVGHAHDHVGHSHCTAVGYRIPALIWRNRVDAPIPADLAQRPFRADWAGWTLTDHLLGIRWSADAPERHVLTAAYRKQAPRLRAAPGLVPRLNLRLKRPLCDTRRRDFSND